MKHIHQPESMAHRCWHQAIVPPPSEQDLLQRGLSPPSGLRPATVSQLCLQLCDPSFLPLEPCFITWCLGVCAGHLGGTAMHLTLATTLPRTWRCGQRAVGVCVVLQRTQQTSASGDAVLGQGDQPALVVWGLESGFFSNGAIATLPINGGRPAPGSLTHPSCLAGLSEGERTWSFV